jgi:hypothetical protein
MGSDKGLTNPFNRTESRLRRIDHTGSMTCEVDANRRIVLLTIKGTISLEDVLSVQAKVRASPGFDPAFHLLADVTQADLSEITPEIMRRLVDNRPADRSSRRAILVADDASFGLARMFQAFSEIAERGNQARVFRDRDEAMRWLAG